MAELMLDFFILGVIGAMLGIFYMNCLKSRNIYSMGKTLTKQKCGM